MIFSLIKQEKTAFKMYANLAREFVARSITIGILKNTVLIAIDINLNIKRNWLTRRGLEIENFEKK